ncbi:MAG TPA: DNA mismatch repair endonuclease MutL [Bacteroidia bacterium]|nr:DNA mismatch repair endonuclease MutL [Bacteroidia bacterium]HNT80138.1 DNA mismatch repair endonuclease MutL [Bacteroidia bacterium]
MKTIIQILPEQVANQIAAGEVIQRPASAVKEMLENAIDAGADQITLLINDAGKELIQVIDNGCGMNTFDARMCFERHATSKIRKAEDLHSIHTMGFRGEALASIASVAQVELKTKLHDEETGTQIIIEGGKVTSHEACSTSSGSSLSVKNLFFNLPARRNFLKSNPVETRHIIEEYNRVALAYPNVSFKLMINGTETSQVKAGNMRHRICSLFGQAYDERLVPIDEDTRLIKISGYILKPEFARKTRGEQYFFVNNRFIKDAYLNHAILTGYKDLLSQGSYPSYFIHLSIDPANIDVNIHPTKHEIKFIDEKSIYAILRAAVKRSLGRFSVSPSLDFDVDPAIQIPLSKYKEKPVQPSITVNKNYNPFATSDLRKEKESPESWDSFYKDLNRSTKTAVEVQQKVDVSIEENIPLRAIGQYAGTYLIAQYGSNFIIGDQQMMHEKVLYESFLFHLEHQAASSQQSLFPNTIQLNVKQAETFKEINPYLKQVGFDVQDFGKNTIAIHGLPSLALNENSESLLLELIDDFEQSNIPNIQIKEKVARTLSKRFALKRGKILEKVEIESLLNELMNSPSPAIHPSGKLCYKQMTSDQLFNWIQSK